MLQGQVNSFSNVRKHLSFWKKIEIFFIKTYKKKPHLKKLEIQTFLNNTQIDKKLIITNI